MKRKFLITALCAALLFTGCSEREAALYTSGEDGGTYSSTSSGTAEGSEPADGESSSSTAGTGGSSSSTSSSSTSTTSSTESSSTTSSMESSSKSSSSSSKQSSSSTASKQSSSKSSSTSSTSSKPETVTPEIIGAYDQRRQTAEEKAFCDEVFDLVNEQRAKNGLEPFNKMDKLTEAAVARAWENTVLYGHTRPDGASCFTILKENGLNYRACAENVAAGYTTPAAVVGGWMNSPGHRANILNPDYEYLGVGFYRESGGWDGYGYYWAQVFYTPL